MWEQYLFHYVSEGGLTYMVMADDSVGRRMPFAFLAELQRQVGWLQVHSISTNHSALQFSESYSPEAILDVPAYGLNEFSPRIDGLMNQFSTSPPNDVLTQTREEINHVRDIMVQNVEQILSRGERIELLVDKTDNLNNQAWAFRRGFVGSTPLTLN